MQKNLLISTLLCTTLSLSTSYCNLIHDIKELWNGHPNNIVQVTPATESDFYLKLGAAIIISGIVGSVLTHIWQQRTNLTEKISDKLAHLEKIYTDIQKYHAQALLVQQDAQYPADNQKLVESIKIVIAKNTTDANLTMVEYNFRYYAYPYLYQLSEHVQILKNQLDDLQEFAPLVPAFESLHGKYRILIKQLEAIDKQTQEILVQTQPTCAKPSADNQDSTYSETTIINNIVQTPRPAIVYIPGHNFTNTNGQKEKNQATAKPVQTDSDMIEPGGQFFYANA